MLKNGMNAEDIKKTVLFCEGWSFYQDGEDSNWSMDSTDGDDAHHFELNLDEDGELSGVALKHNGDFIAGWTYEDIITNTDDLENAMDRWNEGGYDNGWE